jgi:DNA-binding Xre family transcriptional regulator
LIKDKKVSVRALQEQTGRALETLQRARGPLIRECRLSTLEAIAGALGVKVKDLFEEVEE